MEACAHHRFQDRENLGSGHRNLLSNPYVLQEGPTEGRVCLQRADDALTGKRESFSEVAFL